MAAGGPVDPTIPLPEGERRGAPQPPEGADPTGADALPGSYDPTIAVPPVGPPDDVDPYGPGPGDGDDEPDNRRWIWGILAALGVIVLGVVIALLVTGGDDGKDKTASSTSSSAVTSSSTSTSTSTSTTPPTTQPGAPVITGFTATPSPFPCTAPNGGQVTLTWSTTNASGVTVSIDGPGVFASYGPQGQQQVPFAGCSGSHSYLLTAKGANNQQAQQTIVVQAQPTATTTTTTAPPPTTTTTN